LYDELVAVLDSNYSFYLLDLETGAIRERIALIETNGKVIVMPLMVGDHLIVAYEGAVAAHRR
jgi:hypothetical protein